MIFQGYNPFPKKDVAPEIPETVKVAARLIGASHLSSDGSMAYMLRMGKFCWADWLGKSFGMWWSSEAEKIPDGAIEL